MISGQIVRSSLTVSYPWIQILGNVYDLFLLPSGLTSDYFHKYDNNKCTTSAGEYIEVDETSDGKKQS